MPKSAERRVVAIRDGGTDADGVTRINLYGRGVYDGDFPCPMLGGFPNPRITLDDGKGVVWGCECWWGSEDGFDAEYASAVVTEVPVPTRKEWDTVS